MPSTKCQDNTFKDAFTYGMYTRMTLQVFRKLSRSSHIYLGALFSHSPKLVSSIDVFLLQTKDDWAQVLNR